MAIGKVDRNGLDRTFEAPLPLAERVTFEELENHRAHNLLLSMREQFGTAFIFLSS